MKTFVLFVTPAAALIGLARPIALVALLALGAFAAVVTRVGLWLLDDLVPGNPAARALRAGGLTFAAGTAVATSALLLGQVTVVLLAVAGFGALLLALRTDELAGRSRSTLPTGPRPGHPSEEQPCGSS